MGSINVNWYGSCTDRIVQRELVEHVQDIARRSEARIGEPATRPVMLELMTAEREQIAAKNVAAVRLFDESLAGNLILDPLVAMQPRQLMDEAESNDVPKTEIGVGGKDKDEPYCISMSVSPGQWALSVTELHVFGIDFELFDPRKLYPSANRVSFVFVQCPEFPALDGCLCQVENKEQCQAYNGQVLQAADWFITTPNIHLRYLHEEWTDRLLGWVKYFFVPDMFFSRYVEFSGFESFQEQMRNMPESEQTKRDIVKQLLIEKFDSEADDWINQIAELD